MLVALLGWALGAHAQVAINALPANGTPSNADVVATQEQPSARDGDGTVKTTIAQIDSTADTLSNKVYTNPVFQGTATSNGTRQDTLSGYAPQIFGVYMGTNGAPNTAAGAAIQISATESFGSTVPCLSYVDVECNPAFSVTELQSATDYMQGTGIFGGCTGSSSNSPGCVGGYFVGRATGGTETGVGAYVQGERDVSTATAMGAELRVQNNTNTSCATSYNSGAGGCNDLWLSAGNFNTITIASVAITGTAGQFSCTCTNLAIGQYITLSGTYGGTGSITGYANPTTYYVSATNGTSTFTLQTVAQVAIVTTSGTPSGITYTSLVAESAAIQTKQVGNGAFLEGVILGNSTILNYGFDDQSSSTTAFNAGSGHVNSFVGPNFSVTSAGAITGTSETLSTSSGGAVLSSINTASSSFVDSANLLQPNLTTGQVGYMVLGQASSSKNSILFGFNFQGASSNSSYGEVLLPGGSTILQQWFMSGAVAFPQVTTGSNADFVCMSSGGVLTLQTSSCTISSKRFKEHIIDFKADALAGIAQLEVASYNMKPNAEPNKDPNFGSRQTGLIAENIAQVFPQCAIYENDMKTPKSYRQECIIALLVKGEQELMQQNRLLKARLTRVEHPRQIQARLH